MRAAGLSHGGFYKDFSSRDELIAEAVERALTDSESRVRETAGGAEDPLAAFADSYLSTAHRDDAATGCGVVALGTDTPPIVQPHHNPHRAHVERYLAAFQWLLDDD